MGAVGMVVGDEAALTTADTITRDVPVGMSHTVTPKTGTATGLAAWAAGFDLVLVAATADPALVDGQLRGVAVPVVVIGSTGGGGSRWSVHGIAGTISSSLNDSWGVAAGVSGQAIVGGRTGGVTAWSSTSARSAWVSSLPAAGVPLWLQSGDPTRITAMYLPSGAALDGGGTAGANRYGISGHSTAVDTYSAAPAEWRSLLGDLIAHALPASPPAPSPTVSIAPVSAKTVGVPFVVDATIDLNGGAAITGYAWTASDPSVTFTDPAVEDPQVTFTQAGTHTLTLVVTNGAGKTGESSTDVTATVTAPPVGSGRYRWDGTALARTRGRIVYLGGDTYRDLATDTTFTTAGWAAHFA